MKNKINNFDDFLKARNTFFNSLGSSEQSLRRLGIYLNTKSNCIGVTLNWHSMDDIAARVGKRDFFDELTQAQCFALAIAVSEELANGYCDDSEIALVNKFFNVEVTRDMINKLNGEFI